MANGEFIHCARLITRKWRIRSSSNSHASHTAHKEPPIHTNIFVRIDDVTTCPLLVEPTRHRWFPLTRGNWCGALIFVQLFAWTNCWTNIPVVGGLRRYRSHFHYWNFDRLSYSFELERCFMYSLPRRIFTPTMVHTYIVCVCRRTDRRTDKVQPITNIPLPPSQEENGIAISSYKSVW